MYRVQSGERYRLSVVCENERRALSSTRAFVEGEFGPVLEDAWKALADVPSASFKKNQVVEVVFVDIREPVRSLPETPGAPIESVHVNGGLTQFPSDAVTPVRILVYRREDAGKVLIHELIHAAGVVPHRIGVERGEAVTETLACYLWALWKRDDLAKTAEHLQTVALRVVDHFRGTEWRESTHAFSYIVVRAALWSPPFLKSLLSMPVPYDETALVKLVRKAGRAWHKKLLMLPTPPKADGSQLARGARVQQTRRLGATLG